MVGVVSWLEKALYVPWVAYVRCSLAATVENKQANSCSIIVSIPTSCGLDLEYSHADT